MLPSYLSGSSRWRSLNPPWLWSLQVSHCCSEDPLAASESLAPHRSHCLTASTQDLIVDERADSLTEVTSFTITIHHIGRLSSTEGSKIQYGLKRVLSARAFGRASLSSSFRKSSSLLSMYPPTLTPKEGRSRDGRAREGRANER